MTDNNNFQAPINNPIEKDIDRGAWVLNQEAGTLAFSNTTGQQRVHLTHRTGANMKMDNRSFSFFSPNTYQSLTHGRRFDTTFNDTFTTTHMNSEHRSYGDFRVITGSPNFFNDTLAQEWVDKYAEVAEAINTPERQIGGIGNVTEKNNPLKGRPSAAGSVEGGSYSKSKVSGKVKDVMIKAQERLTEIEKQMGRGGNIILNSAKQVNIHAGAASCKYDSGVLVKNGLCVRKNYRVLSPQRSGSRPWTMSGTGRQQPVLTYAPVYKNTNSSGNSPFGEMNITAGNKIMMKSGSGGIAIESAGETHISANGRLSLGGAEVAIGSASKNNAGSFRCFCDSDIFLRSNRLAHVVAPEVQLTGEDQVTIATPKTHITDRTYIHGPLHVHNDTIYNKDVHIDRNLHVDGNITCSGNVYVVKDVKSRCSLAGSGGVRLHTHRHPYYWTHRGGRSTTSSPVNPS